MAASRYYVDNVREPARVVLRQGETFPTALRVANAIKVVRGGEATVGKPSLSLLGLEIDLSLLDRALAAEQLVPVLEQVTTPPATAPASPALLSSSPNIFARACAYARSRSSMDFCLLFLVPAPPALAFLF